MSGFSPSTILGPPVLLVGGIGLIAGSMRSHGTRKSPRERPHGLLAGLFAYNCSVRLKRVILLPGLLAFLCLGYAGYCALAPARTPAGQPTLTDLDRSGFGAFERIFDDAADRVRVVALFSPT